MKSLIQVAIVLLISTMSYGQNQDKIESFKVAFITQRLNLSSEEAQKFWPIFNELQANLKSIKQSSRNQKPIADMSDDEASRFIKESLDAEQKELTAKQTAYNKFKGVIPARKIALLRQVEREFKEEMLKKLQERRQMKKNRFKDDEE
jgi:hypothetical protein